MLENGKVITFDRKKHFKYIDRLGKGGTGETHLFEDETTNTMFAIKKYVPVNGNDVDDCYERFVDEIKILFTLAHPNIVRVYNHYLYPLSKSGYLQMEYIKGVTINNFKCTLEKNWNDLFIEAVYAFVYLEKNRVLHRDIKANNIMVDENKNLKVIDFGFGKKYNSQMVDGKNSVFLNWPANTLPVEIFENTYNHRTDMFFLGKLFSELTLKENVVPFKFGHILEKMIQVEPSERYGTFEEVSRDISKGIFGEIEFTDSDKKIYMELADFITDNLIEFTDFFTPITDTAEVIDNLEEIIRMNALEDYIINTPKLIKCFVRGSFNYKPGRYLEKRVVTGFYQFFDNLTDVKKQIVLGGLLNRFSIIEVNVDEDDFIPF
ncbi:MAG TPA: hypothetical protein DCX03_00960 [Bacteroidales bacterium]|nr:protein kinase family protein [Acetobacterium sp.]HAW57577.1 hypothetical protein [Bacteroidales bacterium]